MTIMRNDVGLGMILANTVFFFIILSAAQTLHQTGMYDIETTQQAAQALRPFGNISYFLFAIGIIGTGLLAVPILAGSGAYALSEMMRWHEGLDLKFARAKGFYMVIAVSILCGLLFNFFSINPIKALYYAAYINGIIAFPILILIMLIGDNSKIMGKEIHPVWVKFFGWMTVVLMGLAIFFSVLISLFF